ncbi:MAG: peptidoglycan DD-metalloendopeptidase family protein [Chlorobi bacterium]|nr:peptidoglycan DD-metalloendopeptidase family protein [Chlorobiota bacterium]
MEAKRKKLEKEIEYTGKLIGKTRKDKSVTVNELRLLNSQIERRKELIETLQTEIKRLNTDIENDEASIDRLNKKLAEVKKKYAGIVYFAYHHQTAYNKLIFLFSAEDFNQAYQRLRYLEQLAAYLRKEADNIRKLEKEKEDDLAALNRQVEEKKALLDNENLQMSKLEQEKARKNQLIKQLSGKEKQLKARLRKKQKEAERLNKKIRDIIARETKAKTSARTGKKYVLTPAEKALSANFAENKGKLPWPVERGVVSETFGVHQHPVLKYVKTRNNGINITTDKGTDARCVFSGEVVSIARITTTNQAVIVKHGDYFTVYSNLIEVYVSKGDHVKVKQPLGKIYTNPDGQTRLHFEVWKGKEFQNPAYWILKR